MTEFWKQDKAIEPNWWDGDKALSVITEKPFADPNDMTLEYPDISSTDAKESINAADILEIPLDYAEEINVKREGEKLERPGLFMRGIKGFVNKAFVQPFKNIQKYSTLGELDTQMEALSEIRRIKEEEGRDVDADEIPKIFEKAKATVGQRIQEQLPSLQMPPPKGVAEKGVEIITGVGAFVTKLAIARRFVGGSGVAAEIAAFEVVNIVDKGTPGMGVLLASSLGLVGKIPAATPLGKAGKLAGQGGVLAGITAAEGGSPEDMAVAFLLPSVLTTLKQFPHLVRGKGFEAKIAKEVKAQGFAAKDAKSIAKSVRDAVEVKGGRMSPNAWGAKHGKNLNNIRNKYNKAVDNVTQQTKAIQKTKALKAAAKITPAPKAKPPVTEKVEAVPIEERISLLDYKKAKLREAGVSEKPRSVREKIKRDDILEQAVKEYDELYPEPPEAASTAEKQLWEMTREEFLKNELSRVGRLLSEASEGEKKAAFKQHKTIIEVAKQNNKAVPPEVLAEYPELKGEKVESFAEMNKRLYAERQAEETLPELVKSGIFRKRQGETNWSWDWDRASSEERKVVDKWLVDSGHELAMQPGSPEGRFKALVEEYAVKAQPTEVKKATVDKKLIEGWLPKIKTKLIEQEVKNLSDSELKRAFKGTAAENRLIEYSKMMRESGDLKYEDVAVVKPAEKPKAEPLTKEEKNQLRDMGYSVPDIIKMDRKAARKKITDNYIKHIDNPKHEAGFVRVPIPESVQEAAQKAKERGKIHAKNVKSDIDSLRFYPNAPPEFRNAVRTDLIGAVSKATKNVYENAQNAIWGGMDKADIGKSVEILYARDQLSRTKLGKGNPEINLEQSQEILDNVMEDASSEAIAAADRYRAIVDKYTAKLIERGVLEEGQQIQDYVRHYVEDYTPEWAPYANIPTRLKRPFRGYAKKAVGTTKAYRQDQSSLLASMMEMEHHNLVEDFIETQVKKYDIKPKMSKEARREMFGTDARGYARTPRPGRIYIHEGKRYRAYTPDIPFSRAIYMTSEGEAALGSFKNVSLIPEEMYNLFRDFSERGSRGIYLLNRATGWWKTMAILSHFPSFNVNNMVGDTWVAMTQHPKPQSFLTEYETALRYLTGKLEPEYAKQLDDFISKHDIKQTFSQTEMLAGRNSKNPIHWLLVKARDVSDFRESINRVAYASSMLKAQQRGEGEKMVEAHNWIDTEGLSTEDALGKISREVLVDYAAQSKTFRRFIRGGVAPFGTWYFKMSSTIWKWFSKHPFKAALSFMALPIAAAAYNRRNEESKELEERLPDYIRNRTHFVLGENPDGTIRTLSLQLPQDVLIGTKIFSIVTDYTSRVIGGEMTPKEAAIETMKTWGISEYEGAKYLLTPWLRMYSGLKTGRDPYDKAPVYRREYNRLTTAEKAIDISAYIVKTSVPFLGTTIQTYEKGLPQDIAFKKLMDRLAGKGALGIYDVNKKGQIVIEKDGKKTTIEFKDVENIRKLAVQEYKYLGQIEDAWVATDLELGEFVVSDMVTKPLSRIYDNYAKRIPEIPTDIDDSKKAYIVGEVLKKRLANRIILPRVKQKKLQVQIARAKTDKEKRELAIKYKKAQQERLEEIIKQQPSTARDIEIITKLKKFLEQ